MSKKKIKNESPSVNKKGLTNSILGIFTADPTKIYNYKQIASLLSLQSNEERKLINTILAEMRDEGYLNEIFSGKFKMKSSGASLIGKIEITSGGYGFFITDSEEDDIFISQNNLNHALHGDTVKVYPFARRKKSKPEGEVIEILERARTKFVGILDANERFAFLIADSRQMPFDIFIPLDKLNGAKNGEKVQVKFTDWPKNAKNPFGEVIDILGKPGDHETEMHAILAEFGLPYKFSETIEKEADALPAEITAQDYAQRRDFRKITTFTIDPDDAKDFDDALSLQKLDNAHWEVGVHIADVTHYIKKNSVLDQEAHERGTSVYLVDRVVPMLPERLSNHICSLRPHEEKLCFSAVFELDEEGNLYDEWFGRTVIYSDRRFTYAEAQNVIDTGQGDLVTEILLLNSLAQKLRQERFKAGAISFDREEVKFEIDENGKPLGIKFREHGLSNELIEEFMLLANKRVAEFVGGGNSKKTKKTFVYRIHDKPNQEKLERFAAFIRKFGHNMLLFSEQKISSSLNKVLHDVKNKPEQNIVETLAVRSMAKAIYSTTNIGHYGLSFKNYTHFTSPIRRYPDMMVHRMLFDYLNNGDSKNKSKYEDLCKHSSDMEQRASEAERASIKYKQVEFMMDKVGKTFDGIISGITEFGFYVEITDNKCEGMVSIRELNDDFYEYDEDNYCLTGRHRRKTFQLGDKVNIKVLKANLIKKQLDFGISGETE